MSTPIRIAVTGAAGKVGYSLLFRIAAGAMFGPEQPVELSLLGSPEGQARLDPIQMELFDCAFPMLVQVQATTDAFQAFDGADWVILLGSTPYRPGLQRSDLLLANGPICREHGQAINEAAPGARILVVANPCNTNCLVARSVAPDVPSGHWFALTRLDQSRARALIAEKADVSPDRVKRVVAWGRHGPTIYPDFHNSTIDDRPAYEVIDDPHWVRTTFEPSTRERGRQILRARGSSPAASAAQAIIGTVRSLITPTPFGHRFSAAVVSDGSYGVPYGLIFGFPLRTEDGKTWSIVPGLYHEDYALERLAQNVSELEQEAAIVTDLLGTVI